MMRVGYHPRPVRGLGDLSASCDVTVAQIQTAINYGWEAARKSPLTVDGIAGVKTRLALEAVLGPGWIMKFPAEILDALRQKYPGAPGVEFTCPGTKAPAGQPTTGTAKLPTIPAEWYEGTWVWVAGAGVLALLAFLFMQKAPARVAPAPVPTPVPSPTK